MTEDAQKDTKGAHQFQRRSLLGTSAISRLVEKVMKEEGLTLADALRKVYDSKLFGQINDPETGLYREGPVFLYDMLCEEQQFALVSRT